MDRRFELLSAAKERAGENLLANVTTMDVLRIAKRTGSIVWGGRLWKPQHASLALRHWYARERNELRTFSDDVHLRAAASWLACAQDSTGDGGVAGRYSLRSGWSSSYPETTGYIVPTFLGLARTLDDASWRERARRAVNFLLAVQLPSGAFPGMEIADNRTAPSVFNSAQIVAGLRAWLVETGDCRVAAAARRAADWLVDHQDPDGAWRRFLYLDGPPYTYMAHAACWVAQLGQTLGEARYVESGARHLNWVLTRVDPETGWFDDCGFTADDHRARRAHTHTIAYTIWGTHLLAQITGDAAGLAAAHRAALAVARRLELSRWLAGVLDWRWRPQVEYACLTGNAQMALIWLAMHEIESDALLLSAACKALDMVKRAQPLDLSHPALHGGIPGSDPIWGDYIRLAIPNWAAKFFVDALIAKRHALNNLCVAAPASDRIGDGVALPPPPHSLPKRLPKVVVLAPSGSSKLRQLLRASEAHGWAPDAIAISSEPKPGALRGALRGALSTIRCGGFRTFSSKIVRRLSGDRARRIEPSPAGMEDGGLVTPPGTRVVRVGSLTDPTTLNVLRSLEPDVFVCGGVGILRKGILGIPRLGTVNAHMGILPPARGMNVTEWSRLLGLPIGCSVHLVDEGIDTGAILATRGVDVSAASTVAELRRLVDEAQIALLVEVLEHIRACGELPTPREQSPNGRQFFQMHWEVRAALERELNSPQDGRMAVPS